MKTKTKLRGIDGVRLLEFLCPLIYFASYITRKNYSIVIAEIVLAEGITESVAGMADMLALISYGAGQIISGILGDKYKPRSLILAGLTATTGMNLLMGVVGDPYLRAVFWCVNGFAQSLLWPPLVRIMASAMDSETYNKACVNVNIAGISGTIFIYLTASTIWIRYFTWKYVFFFSAFLCAVITVLWSILSKKTPQPGARVSHRREIVPTAAKLSKKTLLGSGILLIAVAIIMQGALRDGVTTWVPSFIVETFRVDSGSAILKSVLLPIVGIVSLKLAGLLQRKLLKNEISAASTLFGLGLVFCVALFFLYDKNQYVSLVLAALLTGCMHGVNLFLVCVVPAGFEKYGMVSTMSGVINSLTYVGSALATEGFALTKQYAGWSATVGSWIVIAALGVLCCVGSLRPWKRFRQTEQ